MGEKESEARKGRGESFSKNCVATALSQLFMIFKLAN